MLEPCDAKVSCTVLRGLGDRKVARLLGRCRAVVPAALLVGQTSTFRRHRRVVINLSVRLASFI